jgi:cytoplasmic iron level regulating protein YaaA (DUF328/UPF0246 family)
MDLDALSFPSLTATRRQVLESLEDLCRGDLETAATVLGLGPTQRGEVGANARLRGEPAAPAIEVYTGVLYEALDYSTLTPAARRRVDTHVAIASALWGLVRPTDRIPAYRLSAGTTLPGLGTLASAWRGPIAGTLEATDGLIVDLRSSGYVTLGPIPASAVDRTVTVRVLQERAGKRTVVSHFNKATKGRLVRQLLSSRRNPPTPEAFAKTLVALGYRVEATPTSARGAHSYDVVVTDL